MQEYCDAACFVSEQALLTVCILGGADTAAGSWQLGCFFCNTLRQPCRCGRQTWAIVQAAHSPTSVLVESLQSFVGLANAFVPDDRGGFQQECIRGMVVVLAIIFK